MKKIANNKPAEELLNAYVGFLRALYFLNQSAHWKVKGLAFYGDHLLMERLYKSAEDNSDMAAEKFVGLFGREGLNIATHAEIVKSLIEKYSDLDPMQTSLAAEKEFLELSTMTYDNLEKLGAMTLGLDDCMMSIHNKREEAVYLLQQILV